MIYRCDQFIPVVPITALCNVQVTSLHLSLPIRLPPRVDFLLGPRQR